MRTLIVLVILSTLGACSSAPKVETPTGNNRVPVHNEPALTACQAQLRQDDEDAKRRVELEAQVATLQRQVAELKTYIVLKAKEYETNTPKGLSTLKISK